MTAIASAEPRRCAGWGLFLLCWFVYAVHWAPFMIREQFPAITLATQGTLNVARFADWSSDIFTRPDGRAFINNNPGASIVGALPLIAARPALDAIARWNDRSPSPASRRMASELGSRAPAQFRERREWYILAVAFATSVGAMAPVSALAVTVLARSLAASGIPSALAVQAGLAFGFATPVFVRTGYLSHNLLVAHAALFGGLLLWNGGRNDVSRGRLLAAGALAGFAVLCDYSGILLLGTGVLYTWIRAGDRAKDVRRRLRACLCFALGAAPFLAALALYQWWAFGASVLPSQHYMTAIEETERGYRGMDWPSLETAAMNFFDPRFGLFAVCPVLLLGLAAPFAKRTRFHVPRREMWMILLFFGAFTLFCAANQYSRLQWNTGIRYLVPTVPWLLLLGLPVLDTFPRWLRGGVLGASVVLAWLPAITHRPLMSVLHDPSEFQLSWIRRIGEYGVLSHETVVSIVILLTGTALITAIWRRTCGPRAYAATSGAAGRSG